jgi:phospholipase/carboxylesterase
VLNCFEIEATEPQRGSVIWLHGLGASNHDFESIVPELGAGFLRFVFPQAPLRPVTVNQGMRMPAWYDIISFDPPPLREKEADVRDAERELVALIEREHARGVRYEQILLAGFSQGAAMALHVGVRSEQRLAGILALSGYLLLPQQLQAEQQPANRQTPILACHGRYDPVVPLGLGKAGAAQLKESGYPIEWQEFDMEHSLCIEEVHLIRDWLKTLFATQA